MTTRFYGLSPLGLVLSAALVISGCAGGELSTREKGAGIGALGGAAVGGAIGAAVRHPGAGAAIGGVLGLGAGRRVPRWQEASGKFEPAVEANLSLSFDHRVLDGGAAGRLLVRLTDLMMHPEQL
mgnify:CR=1 FL=1